MIEIKNIKKSFNGKDVLLGIDGVFKKGETNLIIGGSGTGKSVLLKCIIGLIKPDEGTVLYNGRDFYGGDQESFQAIRREMGVLFQGGALFDSKTVAENVRFPLDMLTNQSNSEKEDRVQFCLERVGLDQAAHRMPSEISGGMKKRVGIARAIVMNPSYLFCDEPNSGLDPLTAVKIDELIQEITHEYKITTVVITHDMNSVMEIGQNIIFLYQGRKLWEGNSQTITDSDVPELNEFMFSNKLLRDLRKTG
ncbi:MAG: ATP-binding cassette domain-containing protein [Spirosomataceae bacterium]